MLTLSKLTMIAIAFPFNNLVGQITLHTNNVVALPVKPVQVKRTEQEAYAEEFIRGCMFFDERYTTKEQLSRAIAVFHRHCINPWDGQVALMYAAQELSK